MTYKIINFIQADPPDCSKIPREDAVGVTVVLLTCSYKNQEFIRVGYYVNNEYSEPEMKENPPLEPDYTMVMYLLVNFGFMSCIVLKTGFYFDILAMVWVPFDHVALGLSSSKNENVSYENRRTHLLNSIILCRLNDNV